jgi:hypothetical protein
VEFLLATHHMHYLEQHLNSMTKCTNTEQGLPV